VFLSPKMPRTPRQAVRIGKPRLVSSFPLPGPRLRQNPQSPGQITIRFQAQPVTHRAQKRPPYLARRQLSWLRSIQFKMLSPRQPVASNQRRIAFHRANSHGCHESRRPPRRLDVWIRSQPIYLQEVHPLANGRGSSAKVAGWRQSSAQSRAVPCSS
jgi:hypothetical protein